MINVNILEKHFITNGIFYELDKGDDDSVFKVDYDIADVGMVAIGIFVANNDRLVNITAYKYLPVHNIEKMYNITKLINILNNEYMLVKFIENDKAVSVLITLPFNDNFSPKVIHDMMITLCKIIQIVHPRLMQVMWS
jgi:hypothetical protein